MFFLLFFMFCCFIRGVKEAFWGSLGSFFTEVKVGTFPCKCPRVFH